MFGRSAAARGGGALPILTYHSLDDSGSVLSVAPSVFAEHLRILHEAAISTLSLPAAAEALRSGRGPAGAVVLTFDDGFENFYQHAYPALRRYGFTATIFLVTDYCGRDSSWPSQPAHVARRPLLHWAQVREMSEAGLAFGAHSRTHPDLTRLSIGEAEAEVVASKHAIEEALQRPVESFAYPYGAYDAAVKRLTARHFPIACSTRLGFATPGSDLLALERLDMYYLRHPRLFRRLVSGEARTYIRMRRLARDVRPMLAGRFGRRPGPSRSEP
ncbi:MAG TPA: polysaccharide deacetylase family protein [Candidatus Limnocylindrales bacterium]|nr:polysaccharide deacetylase family protein [Candidatus Limnocylindrales bacterium]